MSDSEIPPFGAKSDLRFSVRKSDPAADPAYDSNPAIQGADSEHLKRLQWGRRMSIFAAVGMGAFVSIFFICAGFSALFFLYVFRRHAHLASSAQTMRDDLAIFMLPMMPAFFFSVLGIVTLVTFTRFLSAFANPTPTPPEDDGILERLIRELVAAARALRGKGDS